MTSNPTSQEATQFLRAFGETQVPLIAYCEPTVIELTTKRAIVEIPLNKRTKNHLDSMYFGALAIGADCAGGLLAMHLSQHSGHPIALIFKSSKAEYLKRPEGPTQFTCDSGDLILETIREIEATGTRHTIPIDIIATVPTVLGDTPVAKFELMLSMKSA